MRSRVPDRLALDSDRGHARLAALPRHKNSKQTGASGVYEDVRGAWRQRAGRAVMLLVLVAGGVKGLDFGLRNAPLPPSAVRLLRYFERLDGAAYQNWWERLAVSLLLSRDNTATDAALGVVPAEPLYLVAGRRVGGGGQP